MHDAANFVDNANSFNVDEEQNVPSEDNVGLRERERAAEELIGVGFRSTMICSLSHKLSSSYGFSCLATKQA